jgi:hypothetical protein
MDKPLVDVTTLNGVQSLFMPGPKDPWAKALAGALADLYIYGDVIRYALAVPGAGSREGLEEPHLLHDLAIHDSSVLTPARYSVSEPKILKDEYLHSCFDEFSAWAINNRPTLQRWLRLHHESWIYPIPNTEREHVFSLEKLRDHSVVAITAKKTKMSRADLFFAFDIILRYPLYGQLAGAHEWYLNHPIRDTIQLPTMTSMSAKLPGVAVSFKKSIAGFASKLSQDEYTALLHELRSAVRDRGLHRLQPGDFDKEVIRELACEVRLPPRASKLSATFGIAGGVIGGLGAIPILGPFAPIAGALITIASTLWRGQLPRSISNVQWLRWALEWDVEHQAKPRE